MTSPFTRLGDIAHEVKRTAKSDSPLPVYSVTKHQGFVPSLEYFKKQVFSRDTKGYNEVRPGELAYATIHLDEGSIGVCPAHSIISPMYTVFAVDEGRVSAAYLERYLKSPRALSIYKTLGKGSVHRRASISFERLASLSIPLPPLPEQRRIAAILDKADALRAKRREAIAKLDQLLQSVFLDMFGDPVTNPKGYPVLSLGEVTQQVTDGAHHTPERQIDGIPLLSARNVLMGELDFSNTDFVGHDEYERLRKRCEPSRGDILISCSGSIGRVATVRTTRPFVLVRSAALIKLKTDLVYAPFMEHQLRTPHLQRQMATSAKSSSQANLFQGPIKALKLVMPPMVDQQNFSRVAEKEEGARAGLLQSAGVLDALSQSLQDRAFRGH